MEETKVQVINLVNLNQRSPATTPI